MNIKNLIKAIIIGIAKIIPGLSGTILMITFNLYDKAIDSITRFWNNPKKNFFFLITLATGVLIGVVTFSKIISYLINNYYIYTISLFIGLILGGILTIKKEIKNNLKNYIYIIISFIIMYYISRTNLTNIYILKNNFIDILTFFIAGLLEAIGTIVPGISSTALLMLLGIYPYYIDILSNLLNINYLITNLNFLIPFLIGLILGIITISLIISYLLRYHKEKTFSIILGLSLSTILTLSISIIQKITNTYIIFPCIILLLIGFLLTTKINQ